VAPVFLLTGVGSMLGVLANRLARVVDRARALESRYPQAPQGERHNLALALVSLKRRARLIGWAISLCVGCGLMIAGVVVVLFVGSLLELPFGAPVAVLFTTGLVMLICALLCFLREVYLATQHLRIGLPDDDLRRRG
jgi:Na+/melibiose symporter-like transporter